MKNILKSRIKVSHLVPIFVFLIAAQLFPSRFQKISHRRHLFFTFQKNIHSAIPVGTAGEVFNRKDSPPVGTFRIIDQSGSEYLCKIQSFYNNGKQTFQWALVQIKKSASQTETIRIGPHTFDRLPGVPGRFISVTPHRINDITPQSIGGIKNHLYRIEKLSNNRYSAELIAFESIASLNLEEKIRSIGKQKIMLGTREGKICMIYPKEKTIACSEISEGTIGKFKDTLCFYIIIKKNLT